MGVRDIGGDLAGDVELIAVEVKAGNQPFSKAVGQAYSYSVCAERCYLADFRPGPRPFELGEIDIASKMGVGLLAIRRNGSISEILASPQHSPMVHMRSQVFENMYLGQCTICGSVFQFGEDSRYTSHVSSTLTNALKQERGYFYNLLEVGQRKARNRKYVWECRYICADCVANIFCEIIPLE